MVKVNTGRDEAAPNLMRSYFENSGHWRNRQSSRCVFTINARQKAAILRFKVDFEDNAFIT